MRATARKTLRQRILDLLGESPLPVPTSDIVILCAFDLRSARKRVWRVLDQLEGRGEIGRVHWRRKCLDNGRTVKELLWSLNTEG